MAIADRREREKQELRGKILDAARILFASEGYDAVTMRRIAEAIEYSPAAIYLHFADKEALVRELCEGDFLALAQHVEGLVAIADPIERLRALGMAYVEFGLTHPHHYRLMFMEPHQEEPPQQLVKKGDPKTDTYALLRLIVEEALGRGLLREELTDADLIAQTIWAGVHGVVALRTAMANDPWVTWTDARASAALMIDVCIRGVLRADGSTRTGRMTEAR